MKVLHHGAPFAPTRWTNLYFPTTALLFGDPVGGPAAPVFGAGIVDVPVWHPSWMRRRTPKAHSSYWHRSGDAPDRPDALGALQDAIAIGCLTELEELAHTRPLSSYLPPRGAAA
jgi:hypothetical protein